MSAEDIFQISMRTIFSTAARASLSMPVSANSNAQKDVANRRHWRTLAVALLGLSLTACGGGGTSETQTQAPNAGERSQSPSISLLAGASNSPGYIDGSIFEARFQNPAWVIYYTEGVAYLGLHSGPSRMASDGKGNLYILDPPQQVNSLYEANPAYDKGMPIRKISPSGTVSTFKVIQGPNLSVHLAADPEGSLYFTSYNKIHKVTSGGVETVFLTGTSGYQSADVFTLIPNSSTAEPFHLPGPIVFDRNGNLYVSDGPYIRKISKDGTSRLFATLPNGSGATTAMTVDATGNLYLTQAEVQSQPSHALRGQNRSMVIKVEPDGKAIIIAGASEGTGYLDGAGKDAKFYNPTGIAIDDIGNLYVADSMNQVIRKIDANGVVTTVAGTPGVNLAGVGSLPGTLADPYGLTFIGPKTLAVTTGTTVAKIVLP
jgi:sugar lactone lactonase YvrE